MDQFVNAVPFEEVAEQMDQFGKGLSKDEALALTAQWLGIADMATASVATEGPEDRDIQARQVRPPQLAACFMLPPCLPCPRRA